MMGYKQTWWTTFYTFYVTGWQKKILNAVILNSDKSIWNMGMYTSGMQKWRYCYLWIQYYVLIYRFFIFSYLGFCDDACFDYRSDRVFRSKFLFIWRNMYVCACVWGEGDKEMGTWLTLFFLNIDFDATQTPLSTLIEPIQIDTVIGTIVSKPRRLPSLLVFHLSDGYQFDSTFAWIDLHPPMSQFGQHSYSKSYREFGKLQKQNHDILDKYVNWHYLRYFFNIESLLKSLSIPSYAGALNTYQYSMSHMLVDFFSGSYQTMIFAHLEVNYCIVQSWWKNVAILIAQRFFFFW